MLWDCGTAFRLVGDLDLGVSGSRPKLRKNSSSSSWSAQLSKGGLETAGVGLGRLWNKGKKMEKLDK